MKAITSLFTYDLSGEDQKSKKKEKNIRKGGNASNLHGENGDLELSLSDRSQALEILKLQEAAKLAADYQASKRGFRRSDKLSHVANASLNLLQLVSRFRAYT